MQWNIAHLFKKIHHEICRQIPELGIPDLGRQNWYIFTYMWILVFNSVIANLQPRGCI